MSAQFFMDFNDASGTITSGGTAQTALARSATQQRSFLLIQNNSSSDSLWFNIGVSAVTNQPSIQLLPGGAGTIVFSNPGLVPQGYVSIIGATTGDSFTLKYA